MHRVDIQERTTVSMPLGAKYAISRDRFLILNPLKQLSARKAYQYPSVPCTTFVHRARSTGMGSANSDAPSAGSNVIARLLSSNTRWAADVAASHPTFFPECAQGQQPQVGSLMTRFLCVRSGCLMFVFFFPKGTLDRMFGFQSSRKRHYSL